MYQMSLMITVTSACVLLLAIEPAVSSKVPADRMHRAAPNEEACAPCGEVDITPRISRIFPQLESAEFFHECCNICKNGGWEGSRSQSTRSSSNSRSSTGSDTCRCLCKSLKLNGFCPEDKCSSTFKHVQCQNELGTTASSADGVHRCIERVFNDKQNYDTCAVMNNGEDLPPSILDSPALIGGVEQCSCVCNYIQRQEGPTDEIPTSTPSDISNTPCSPNFDCTLKKKTRKRISSRMDNDGDSFEDCITKCTRSNDGDTKSIRRTQTSSKRSMKSRSQTSSRAAASESDCHCYCSMVHDPCDEEPMTVTDDVSDRDDNSWTIKKSPKTSKTKTPKRKTRTKSINS